MILQVLIAMVAGWLQRHQQQVITYLQEENRVLKAHLGGRQLRLTDFNGASTDEVRIAIELSGEGPRADLEGAPSAAVPDLPAMPALGE